MDTLTTATLAALLILVASILSVELALSAAILEIVLGVFASNVLGLTITPWIDFLDGFASVLLTFLAGAEVDPRFSQRGAGLFHRKNHRYSSPGERGTAGWSAGFSHDERS